ncbi:T9SS type A sorting domain-containing protein [Winogradskyella sp. Asnod2-B02-A]|uniref:T9SS type A sorting domain-containing protein n=1 Tax=Winogradskyella sp. Asnod2-B02-A TaxID=3160583 RepID=UPI00386468A8
MKLKLLYSSLLFSVLFLNNSYAQQTYVPDDIFEEYLINQGYDTVLDNYVLTSNISNVTTVNLNGKNVTDLTGIADFEALNILNVSGTLILNLDVSANTELTNLNAYDTAISSLDLTANSALTNLYVDNTLLNRLDVSTNLALTELYISNTNITSIDVSLNTALTSLSISETSIVLLDVSTNTALTFLSVVNTPVSSLDLSTNTVLTSFKSSNTQNLYCITVADELAATSATGNYSQWQKDADCNYSESCEETFVPDDVFEQYLIDEGYDSGVLDNFVPTANIKNVELVDLSNTTVVDLTGIEDFDSLTTLDISNSNVTALNVSNNISLSLLNINGTLISSLDVSFNINLTSLTSVNTIDLTCITVLDGAAANAGTGIYVDWEKDANCSYSANCSAPLSDTEFNASEVYVGPNPIKNELLIKLNNSDILREVNLFDISGKLVLRSNATTINTSHLESGMYLVQITTEKGSFTRKLVK